MRRVRKHALAESDLISIWEYTFEQWGTAQADKNLDELNDGIQQLSDNPDIDAKRDYVRESYRVLFVNSHAVYYTGSTPHHSGLHDQMDPGRHL